MSDDSGDQIHPATPARIEQARRDGDFAKSYELSAAVQMLGSIAVAYVLFRQLAFWLRNATVEIWSNPGSTASVTTSDVTYQLQGLIFSSLGVLVPIMVLLFLIGVASHWCQTGPVFLSGKVAPDAGRLAPSHWFKRLFSWSSLAYPLIGLPKTILAIVVMMVSVWFNREQFLMLGNYPADQMVQEMFGLVLQVCFHVAMTLLAASVLDLGCKNLSFQKRIQMTDQQLRDELRMQNGDPRIASQRRAIRHSMQGTRANTQVRLGNRN